MDIVVAVTDNWGIGLGGTQTVVIPEDRKFFRTLTKGATVILGRRTLMDFPDAKPLPNAGTLFSPRTHPSQWRAARRRTPWMMR